MSTLNLPGPEPSPVQEFYQVPDFACCPPVSIEYRIRQVDAAKEQRGWNTAKRAQSTFISFGREPPVDLPVSHDSVSRKHAILQYGNGSAGPGWYLFDLGSSHGTFLNDEKIPAKEYVPVEEGASIRLGFASRYKFCITSAHILEENETNLKISYNPPTWRLQVPDNLDYSLEVIENGSIVGNIPLREKLIDANYTTIGSFPETAKIVDKHPSVSRLHAVLQFGLLGKKFGWFLYDNGSSHGTKLNRAKLSPRFYAKLPIGGSFKLGGSKKLYCLNGPDQEQEDAFANKLISKNVEKEAETKTGAKAYAADPIGWLTSHFETEGIPLDFSFTPSGSENIVCSIDLRLAIDVGEDSDTVVRGEGKGRDEAKRNAALLACQIIEAQEENEHLSNYRTRKQEFEENDFYASDEDEFLDRTGSLEVKRKLRKARYQQEDGKEEVLTYETLKKQLEEAQQELNTLQKTHDRIVAESRTTKNLSSKFVISSSRQKLAAIQEEVKRLSALTAAAKPTTMDEMFAKKSNQSVAVDKHDLPSSAPKPIKEESFVEPKNLKRHLKDDVSEPEKMVESQKTEMVPEAASASESEMETKIEEEKPQIPEGYGLIHRKDLQALKNKEMTAKKRKIQKDEEDYFMEEIKDSRDAKTEIAAEPVDEAVWLPPENQTGDGKTKLNEKFAGRY